MIQTNMPAYFLADACLTTSCLNNRLPSTAIENKVPIQMSYPTKPLFPIASRMFGCTCFLHILGPNRDKLGAQATKYDFYQIPKSSETLHCYDPTTHGQLVIADVTFFKSLPYYFLPSTTHEVPSFILLPVPPVSFEFVPCESLFTCSHLHDCPVVYTC